MLNYKLPQRTLALISPRVSHVNKDQRLKLKELISCWEISATDIGEEYKGGVPSGLPIFLKSWTQEVIWKTKLKSCTIMHHSLYLW